MKKTLAYDSEKQQFRSDVGGKRFLLGGDAGTAQRRKASINDLWVNLGSRWDDAGLVTAKTLAKGGAVELKPRGGELEAAYLVREEAMVRSLPPSIPVKGVIMEGDLDKAENLLMKERLAALEAMIAERLGPHATKTNVFVHSALDNFQKEKVATKLDPGTGKPTEYVRTEGNNVALIRRLVADTLKLSALDYATLHRWASAIANRPLSVKTGQPIKSSTARNCLKTLRAFVKYASRYYGYRRPEDWEEAMKVQPKRTKEERLEAMKKLEGHYTLEELGTLWSYALPVERLLILMGLNFGFAQAEIRNMDGAELFKEETAAIRGKSDAVGRWPVWQETRKLAALFQRIPKRRQHISNRWNNLLARVIKDHPEFKTLSFKWLRKTGASYIRTIGGGEMSSLYLCHGEAATTEDKLLMVYAGQNWTKLAAVVTEFRNQLLPFITCDGIPAKLYLPLSVVDQVRKGWEEGLKPGEMVKRFKVSRATLYRYKPLATVNQSSRSR